MATAPAPADWSCLFPSTFAPALCVADVCITAGLDSNGAIRDYLALWVVGRGFLLHKQCGNERGQRGGNCDQRVKAGPEE